MMAMALKTYMGVAQRKAYSTDPYSHQNVYVFIKIVYMVFFIYNKCPDFSSWYPFFAFKRCVRQPLSQLSMDIFGKYFCGLLI